MKPSQILSQRLHEAKKFLRDNPLSTSTVSNSSDLLRLEVENEMYDLEKAIRELSIKGL